MNFTRIVLSYSYRRLWFSLNHNRTIYTAQRESSPLQIYRNKIEAYEVSVQSIKNKESLSKTFSYVLIHVKNN